MTWQLYIKKKQLITKYFWIISRGGAIFNVKSKTTIRMRNNLNIFKRSFNIRTEF